MAQERAQLVAGELGRGSDEPSVLFENLGEGRHGAEQDTRAGPRLFRRRRIRDIQPLRTLRRLLPGPKSPWFSPMTPSHLAMTLLDTKPWLWLALLLALVVALAACARTPRPEENAPAGSPSPAPVAATEVPAPAPIDREALKSRLTPIQWKVTQESGTERAFTGEYWDNHADGIYVDIVDGTPLFSSKDKFDSGCGWPSFTQPLAESPLVEKNDLTHGMVRTEVRSKRADSHLGHVFDDGPKPTGLRYCINSASLRFVPVADLEKEGLGRFLPLFGQQPGAATSSDASAAKAGPTTETAVLAGGCFWGMEDLLRKIPGVLETDCGYTGGHLENPKYDDTHDSKSGHAEAVRIVFDPAKVSYDELLTWFFKIHDPTTLNRQGNDRGTQYRSAIFYANDAQKAAAEKAISVAESKWKKKVVTTLEPAAKWWPAEDYHQDYLVKNPRGYTCHYIRDL